MRKLILIFSAIILYGSLKAQSSLPIKEQYDYLHTKAVFNNTHTGVLNYLLASNPFSGYEYGEQLGYVLESYLNMYKTTKDKAYLIKFINLSLTIMAWRQTDYRFSIDGNVYMDGLLLWSMAHFSYLILYQEPTLNNLIIPTNVLNIPTSTFSQNILPFQPSYTYGYIANWLIQKQVETLDAIIDNHWLSNDQGFKQESSHDYGMAINMQAGFGGALLYLGKLSSNIPAYSGLASYLDKGAAIARLYKSDIDIDDKCHCFLYQYPLLRITSDNSYWWFHSGWKILDNDCFNIGSCFGPHFNQPDYIEYTQYVEDISHGVTTMIVPQVAYEINLYTGGGYPFSTAEMVRFRNMFTKKVFDGNMNDPKFHSGVNGADTPIYEYDNQFNIFKNSSLSYMPLYKWDGADNTATPPNVYDIVMKFYEKNIYPLPTRIGGGMDYNGIALVAAAQWDKECVNLSLYNRKVVYDQDFMVKNTLVVQPQVSDNLYQPGDNSFAEPVINTPEFTIDSGIKVNMVAGEKIRLRSGFRAKAGCKFTAKISENMCTDGMRMANAASSENKENDITKSASPVKFHFISSDETSSSLRYDSVFLSGKNEGLYIAPNPAGSFITVKSVDVDSDYSIVIKDLMGKVVYSDVVVKEKQVDVSDLSNGCYIIEVREKDELLQIKKLIIQH